MAKNILIVPSNTIAPEASRIPYINFENDSIVGLQVLSGATIAFSNQNLSNILSIQPSNLIISVGDSLIVKDYFSVGGTQVINGTSTWSKSPTGVNTSSLSALQTISGGAFTTLTLYGLNSSNTGLVSSGSTTLTITFGLIS